MYRRDFTLSSVAALFFQLHCPNRLLSQIPAEDKSEIAIENGLSGSAEGPWRRLFLDATTVEEQQGLNRQFHSAQKHVSNPIVVADQPWEGTSAITGPYVYGTVLKDGQRYRMWYQVLFQGNPVGYAESDDAIHWQKPALDIIQYEGQSTNFVVSEFNVEKAGGRCHNPNVVLRPKDTNPERRYALYGFDGKASSSVDWFSSLAIGWVLLNVKL